MTGKRAFRRASAGCEMMAPLLAPWCLDPRSRLTALCTELDSMSGVGGQRQRRIQAELKKAWEPKSGGPVGSDQWRGLQVQAQAVKNRADQVLGRP